MSRLIIDTIRYHNLIARLSLSLLIIYIKMRSAKESYIKFHYSNKVRYSSVRVYSANNKALFSKIKNIRDPV